MCIGEYGNQSAQRRSARRDASLAKNRPYCFYASSVANELLWRLEGLVER